MHICPQIQHLAKAFLKGYSLETFKTEQKRSFPIFLLKCYIIMKTYFYKAISYMKLGNKKISICL